MSFRHIGSSLQSFLMSRPCNHCKLIDSGDVVLYQITCPECGGIPPSRKHLYSTLTLTSTDVKEKNA